MEKTPYITKEECEALLKDAAAAEGNQEGILLYVPGYNEFCFLRFGTGDNLLDEDIADGYNDYIYMETKLLLCDSCELAEGGTGGGMYVFNNEKYIKDGTYKITNFVFDALEHGSNYLHCPRFVPLQFLS